jgi:hypothetical protein
VAVLKGNDLIQFFMGKYFTENKQIKNRTNSLVQSAKNKNDQ